MAFRKDQSLDALARVTFTPILATNKHIHKRLNRQREKT
jgi:hypothetical protein